MSSKPCFKTSIGGQAVIEGIMMKGPKMSCLSVRNPKGEITSEVFATKKSPVARIPLVRGAYAMIANMFEGMKYINRSADISFADTGEEKSKFEKKLEEKFGSKLYDGLMVFASFLGVALAVVLFMFVPQELVRLLSRVVELGAFKAAVEGLIKIILFVGYLFAVTRIKDIKRVFAYHGAEHMSIHCYEKGAELTVENARACSRFHPRCGTSFLFIVLIVSIIVSSFIPWDYAFVASAFLNKLVRLVLKILLLPLIMGISYEILKLTGRYDNVITRIVAAPGMWVQRLTTFKPDDSQLEVALAALTAVIPENADEGKW